MTAREYLDAIKKVYVEIGSPEIAEKQMKYMRNQFAFYGIKAAVWGPLVKTFIKEKGWTEGAELKELVQLGMEEEYRELHYFTIEMVQKGLKSQEEDFIQTLEFLVVTESWWDTVDWVAKLVGMHFKRFPQLIKPTTERWMASDNFWLQRVSIIFQLFYKKQTDEKLLYDYILRVAGSNEFFLQKAASWALRQYSKTNPESVNQFIQTHQLSPLTVREGLKWIKKQNG